MTKRDASTKPKGKTPKPKAAEPFFRPFAKLPLRQKEGHRGGRAEEPKAKAPTQGDGRKPADAPRKAEPSAPLDAAPLKPVDAQTFAIYMAGVHALPEDRAHRIPRNADRVERVAAQDRAPPGDADADARASMRSLVTDGLRFETADDGERLEGRRLDVDPRELRRLRRAVYAVDGKLDLHGLAVEEARLAVETFIRKRAREGDRAVLIVHGKGSHSPRGHAVLRGEIAAWLSQGRAARHIAAFASAPDELGGAGAVLVLLAR